MTPKAKGYFRMRNNGAPRFSPANLFSSTIIEETPPAKKVLSRGILEKSSIFESSSSSSTARTTEKSESTPRLKKLSRSLLEKTSFFEDTAKMGVSPSTVETTKNARSSPSLQRNVRSVDPVVFEGNHNSASSPPLPVVRELVKRLEVSESTVRQPDENLHLAWKSKRSHQEKKANSEPRPTPAQRRTSLDSKNHLAAFALRETRTNIEEPSPCTRFLTSKRKSVDLENVVKSKQPSRERSVVRGIIQTLTEKLSRSSSRRNEDVEVHQNFVRKLVSALEKGGNRPVVEESFNERIDEDTGSYSESEAKSCTSSASLKDTDSCSDSDQRSPTLSSHDSDRTFVCGTLATEKSLEDEVKSRQDEDSVYWIPVSRCKLPRTSSLLSLTSKLSTSGQSPCVSPIRSDSESETSPMAPWDATFKKNALSRKLFRIDETVVIDSGYSDRSDRSTVGCSMTDSIWSEDIQNNFNSEIRSTRMKRSSRRKTIVGHTFRVSA